MRVTARDLQDRKGHNRIEYFDDLAPDYRDEANYKAYVIATRRLFENNGTLSIGDIRRLQQESFQPRRILDAIETIDGLEEVSVCPMRWRLR